MTGNHWLIASDLDQTLIGDNDALRLFRERIAPAQAGDTGFTGMTATNQQF